MKKLFRVLLSPFVLVFMALLLIGGLVYQVLSVPRSRYGYPIMYPGSDGRSGRDFSSPSNPCRE